MNSDTKFINFSPPEMDTSFSGVRRLCQTPSQCTRASGSRDINISHFSNPILCSKRGDENVDIKTIIPKQHVKLVITKSSLWNFTEIDLQPEKQLEYIFDNDDTDKINVIVKKNILQKICSYRSQDVIKNKYNYEKFITYNEIIHKLRECNLKCFYCDKVVYILYENVREPMQWSLERIDNKYGHNNDNTEIACLNCNLRRRTMYHERYRMTKKMIIVRTGVEKL